MATSTTIVLICLSIFPFFVSTLKDHHTHSLAFSTYDLNENGFIEPSEFNVLTLELFGNNFSTNTPKKRISPKQMDKLFKMLDFTGDGVIDQVEFPKIWHHWVQPVLNPKSILVVLNMQNDYLLPNGSMYMKGASSIVANINTLIQQENFAKVFYIRDLHSERHCSFNNSDSGTVWKQNNLINVADDEESEITFDCQIRPDLEQVIWPRHCVQGSYGAKFYSDLVIKQDSGHVKIINKGTNPVVDSYSAIFDNNGNSLQLNEDLVQLSSEGKIVTIYVTGVMLEFEIVNTALDAVNLGYPTVVLTDAVWSKDSQDDDLVTDALKKASVIMANSDEVYSMLNGRSRRLEAGFVLANRLFQKYNKQKF